MTIHVVRAGESVYLLSQRYQVPVEVIERDNGIGQDGRLAVGQALFIRSGAQTRVVQPGDSWRALAEQTGQSVRQLLQKNPGLSEQSPPPPGTVLVVAQPEPELGAMRINGYVYPFVDRGVYTKTLPFVSFITLFTYGFTPEGELVLLDDEELIALAAELDVPAYLHFSTLTPEGNFSNELAAALLRNPDLQETVLARLLALMQQKGYGGLDIDFEYVLPEDRENYIAFIQRATETMNAAGYEVIVALAPKTSADQPGLLYEAHDYAGLGAAANAVLLMTYEWGYTYGPPMAVAPINQVRRVLEYAVTEIPPEKIYMTGRCPMSRGNPGRGRWAIRRRSSWPSGWAPPLSMMRWPNPPSSATLMNGARSTRCGLRTPAVSRPRHAWQRSLVSSAWGSGI